MSAIRLARGFTGRDRIIKFAGCYHGHVDALLVSAGSSATTLGVPTSPGVPKGTTADTLVLRYNDVNALEEAFKYAPAGSETVVENVKSAMAAAKSAYDNLASINKQIYATVEGAVEQNVATATAKKSRKR